MFSRLLATDADSYMLKICRLYFPHFGFDVATASDEVACLTQVREFHPDVLVLDLDLPGGGADCVLAALQKSRQDPPIPPVVRLLEKPIRLRDLRSVVEAALAVAPQSPTAIEGGSTVDRTA